MFGNYYNTKNYILQVFEAFTREKSRYIGVLDFFVLEDFSIFNKKTLENFVSILCRFLLYFFRIFLPTYPNKKKVFAV